MREKLIDVFMHLDRHIRNMDEYGICYTSDFAEAVETVLAMLKNQDAHGVTVQKWIPVTERLPEDSLPKESNVKQIKVLVAYKTNGRWIERTQIRAKGYWYNEPNRWSWVKTSDPISHWMPLPSPPSTEVSK